MDWLSFFGSVLGGLIGGIFTFLGVKLTIKHEKNSQEKEMLKNTFEKKPRLEILSVRHYETNMGYISRSHIDIKALFLVIKEVTLNDRPSVYYDEAALKEENLVFFEFEMKNTGLTEIEDICITSNNPQRVAVFNKEKREFYINKHRLNYDLWEHNICIKPGQSLILRTYFLKNNEDFPYKGAATASIWLKDVNGDFWVQPLFIREGDIYNSKPTTYKKLCESTDVDSAIKCFRDPMLW